MLRFLLFIVLFSLVVNCVYNDRHKLKNYLRGQQQKRSVTSIKCDLCKDAIKEVVEKTVISKGCTEGCVEFEVVCNLAGDEIPGWEIGCALAGIAIKEICDHYGDAWISSHLSDVEYDICHAMHFC
eukprot:TRINITY_DN440_c0_g1_i2.p1 TRINITY_DN440_c0_g1~~TRINITY_DN440_c0_g1_i2.p1  ORF type:complete len:126 (-),score=16.50 TRINITY_DN440_c0_g1_i2:96-473(-)